MRTSGRLSWVVATLLVLAGCAEDDGSTGTQPTASAPTTTTSASGSPSATAPGTRVEPASSNSADTLADARQLAVRDGLPLLVPTRLPKGWTFKRAVYGFEGRGNWQLTLADAGGGEVAVRQALVGSPAAFYADITTLLSSAAKPSGTVDLGPLGTWVGYDGVRHPRRFAVGELAGTKVVLWADDATSLEPFAALLDTP